MIFEALLVQDLPATLGPPVVTPFLEGLDRWLFSGHWRRRKASCALSSGAVLARSLAALRALGRWELAIKDDAGVLLDLPLASPRWGEDPASWPERLPEAWTADPCDFQLQATRQEAEAAEVVHLRFAPRHEADAGALVAAIRVAWRPACPADPEALSRRALATVAHERRLGALDQALSARGGALAGALAAALHDRFGGPPATWDPAVRVLHGLDEDPAPFADRLAGFDDDSLALAAVVSARVAASPIRRLAIDRRGVPGHVQAGRFTPNTAREVADAL